MADVSNVEAKTYKMEDFAVYVRATATISMQVSNLLL